MYVRVNDRNVPPCVDAGPTRMLPFGSLFLNTFGSLGKRGTQADLMRRYDGAYARVQTRLEAAVASNFLKTGNNSLKGSKFSRVSTIKWSIDTLLDLPDNVCLSEAEPGVFGYEGAMAYTERSSNIVNRLRGPSSDPFAALLRVIYRSVPVERFCLPRCLGCSRSSTGEQQLKKSILRLGG